MIFISVFFFVNKISKWNIDLQLVLRHRQNLPNWIFLNDNILSNQKNVLINICQLEKAYYCCLFFLILLHKNLKNL